MCIRDSSAESGNSAASICSSGVRLAGWSLASCSTVPSRRPSNGSAGSRTLWIPTTVRRSWSKPCGNTPSW
eukprot:2791618-Alexandrium_andersonii.AAC.1